jgi:hypothetical protein
MNSRRESAPWGGAHEKQRPTEAWCRHSPPNAKSSQASLEAAQCGKRAAVHAYCLGWLSLESCSELFRTNPDWRSA